jgi:glycosyltransferase involved in cell wall biosynthesis
MQQKSINLCMIVKDEAHIIERCLNSVKPLIDKVLIVDTGSSDNTIKVIQDWMEKEGIGGKVVKEQWKNFAHNRSSALEHARQIGCDYSLMIDADEILKYNQNFDATTFKCSLNKDYYLIPTKTKDAFYYRPTFTSNSKPFLYKAPVHEYLEVPDGCSFQDVNHETEFWNVPIQDSSRNNDLQKYQKDAKLLEDALKTEKDDFLISRYTFYLAQSYRDSERPAPALVYYLKRGELGFWDEERYMAYYKAGQCQEKLKHSEDSIISTYLKAQECSPDRCEALHAVVKYCRTHGRNQLAYILGKEGITKKFKEEFLFAEMWAYDYSMLDEFAIAAYWAEHYQESYDACMQLLENPKFPKDQMERLNKNIDFAKDKLNLK